MRVLRTIASQQRCKSLSQSKHAKLEDNHVIPNYQTPLRNPSFLSAHRDSFDRFDLFDLDIFDC